MEIIGKMFNKYEVRFPIDNKLTILHGKNGTGKTKVLETLSKYWEEKNRNVLFFAEDRVLKVKKEQIESIFTMFKMFDDDFFNHASIQSALFNIEEEYGFYINRGTTQQLNFYTQIALAGEDVHLLIDYPEKNLDMLAQRKLIKSLLYFENIKKIVIVTHSPEIIGHLREECLSITECVDLS